MPWTGPLFIRVNEDYSGADVWQSDAAAAILIEAVRHDFHDYDLANGINACLNKNGANSPTANINWGGFRTTNHGAGVAATDVAIYGQTITNATLDSGTNVLTLTRATGGDVSVDLSSLAVGGSTSDFARYSNGANPFQGGATFEGTVGAEFALNIVDSFSGSGTYMWSFTAGTATQMQLSNTTGATWDFLGNAGSATIEVNGDPVWTEATLTPAQIAGFLEAGDSATITGSWIFSNVVFFTGTAISVPGNVVMQVGANTATITYPTSTTWQVQLSTGPGMRLSSNATFGSAFRIGTTNFAWHQGNWQTGLTVLPTGGEDGNMAVVQSGVDKGLYTKIAGVWTLLIAFP
jgi:hypothetical protein